MTPCSALSRCAYPQFYARGRTPRKEDLSGGDAASE
eukprot:COSAG06_NODE_13005_length_1303_cov_1.374585_3_plen_35_part_01